MGNVHLKGDRMSRVSQVVSCIGALFIGRGKRATLPAAPLREARQIAKRRALPGDVNDMSIVSRLQGFHSVLAAPHVQV